MASTLEQFRDLVTARADSGAAPPLDRDIADVDARKAVAETLRQRAAVDAGLAELKAAIGIPQSDLLMFRLGLEQLGESAEFANQKSLDHPIDQAITARPDVKSAEAQVRSASAALNLIKSEARPDVTVNAGYMRMASSFPVYGFDASGARVPVQGIFHNLSIGAMVTLPIGDRRQGDIAAGLARVQALERELEGKRLVAEGEITAARSRVQRLEDALAVYSAGLRSLAAKNVDVVRQSYQLGRATLLDVLTETRRLLDLEIAYTDLMFEALQARSDLAAAMGVIR